LVRRSFYFLEKVKVVLNWIIIVFLCNFYWFVKSFWRSQYNIIYSVCSINCIICNSLVGLVVNIFISLWRCRIISIRFRCNIQKSWYYWLISFKKILLQFYKVVCDWLECINRLLLVFACCIYTFLNNFIACLLIFIDIFIEFICCIWNLLFLLV